MRRYRNLFSVHLGLIPPPDHAAHSNVGITHPKPMKENSAMSDLREVPYNKAKQSDMDIKDFVLCKIY